MNRSLALIAFRVVVIAVALVTLFLTPVVIESQGVRSYDPIGLVIDGVAVLALIIVSATWFRARGR
jgi:hypothetical protein